MSLLFRDSGLGTGGLIRLYCNVCLKNKNHKKILKKEKKRSGYKKDQDFICLDPEPTFRNAQPGFFPQTWPVNPHFNDVPNRL
jgi:hypothetical protein